MKKDYEEKFSLMMCNFEKTLTLIKLLQQMLNENSEFVWSDFYNICSILNKEMHTTYNQLRDLEKSFCSNKNSCR